MAVDPRAVGAFQIGKDQPSAVLLDLRVESADALVIQADAVFVLSTDGVGRVELTKDQDALFKKIGEEDTARVLADLDQKGMPASNVHAAMKAAAANFAKTSFSFWKA